MRCYKERRTLMMERFIIYLRYSKKIGGASESLFKHYMVHIVSFLPRLIPRLCTKCQVWVYHPLSTSNGMLYYKSRHPLLLEHCITSYICERCEGHLSASTSPLWFTRCRTSIEVDPRIPYLITHFGHPQSTGNGMLCRK